MGLGTYLKSKLFFGHLFLSTITFFVLMLIIFMLASSYTDHGETLKVPDFNGLSINQLDKFIIGKDVRYEIIDSIYDPEGKPGTVFNQEPEVGIEVKHNRIIYLYVVSTLPPQIVMPKLVDRSLRQATAMIESYGLKVGKIKPVSDPCANCILKQLTNGKEVQPGDLIKKGSFIDLWVGRGQNNEQVGVPNILGMTLCEAKQKLNAASLSAGALVFDKAVKDSCATFVYRQSPNGSADNYVGVGSSVDLYLTTDKSKVPSKGNDTNFDDDDDEK